MTSTVFYVPLTDAPSMSQQVEAIELIYESLKVDKVLSARRLVAVKISVGEKNNTTHIKPPLVKAVVDRLKKKRTLPFLTETSTLYKGECDNAVRHLLHAHAHGFGVENIGAPFIMADGLVGSSEIDVPISGEIFSEVKIAREVLVADTLIALSHPTGHLATGLGATLKNLGMGLASRMGKMRQHSKMKPEVIPDKCKTCGKCIEWCPEGIIIEKDGKAYINTEQCIGCGECLAVCRFDSVKYDWDADPKYLQKAMAEHAYGSVKDKLGKQAVFINVLVDMTKDCDCMSRSQQKLIPDIGILGSFDPVAVDKATLDLTAAQGGKSLTERAYPRHDPLIQLKHGEKLGMGSLEYELVEVR